MVWFTILIAFISIDIVFSQCSVNIRSNIRKIRDPVFLKESGGNFNLWVPNGPTLDWTAGETTYIACPGSYLKANGAIISPITCSKSWFFYLDGKTYMSSDNFECKYTVTGQLEESSLPCWKNTAIFKKIGYKINNQFLTLIDVCYSMKTGSAKFTRHIIHGKAIAYSAQTDITPAFKSTGTASHVHPHKSYSKESQLNRLTDLLGSKTQAKKFINTDKNSTLFLATGHLSPDNDEIFASWKTSTYFYINAAPEWQVINGNGGNWYNVENAVRIKASSIQKDLIIFTGTEGILTLPHWNGTQIPITLESGRNIEVPKWFWKIIKDPLTNSGIALITLNNPYATRGTIILCLDICSLYGWNNTNYSNYSKGFTYCCSVQSLMAAVPGIPSDAIVSSILSF